MLILVPHRILIAFLHKDNVGNTFNKDLSVAKR